MEKETLFFFADQLRKYCDSNEQCDGCIFSGRGCSLFDAPIMWPDYEAEYEESRKRIELVEE